MESIIEAVIGVDVGGTNTDAVILQTNCQPPKVVSSAKSITTSDVTSGIKSAVITAIEQRDKKQELAIQRVNIGTTHFINAVVQRKELTKVVVIRLCGPSSRQVPPYSDFPQDLAACINGGTYFVDGGYQVDGREISSVNKQEILRVVTESIRNGISQFVICGIYCSFRSEQELHVKTIMKTEFPNVSITLSHEIGQVGLLERENATILNESLKPLCRKTIQGFKKALLEMNLICPLYLTQNDGTVIDDQYALEHPVCTFASGPTNSMRGAAFLSGEKDAIVVDIGGTTTDVGILMKGFPREASTEIQIGGVRTNFRMPAVYSIGLGGGSYIKFEELDNEYSITVGPRSAGYNIKTEAHIFQNDVASCEMDRLTATDLAVAAQHCEIGNKANVSALPVSLVNAGIKKIRSMVETAIDVVKLSSDPLPVILVGGGGIILDCKKGLEGCSEIHFPNHFEVANAVGAALSQISGRVEYVVNLAENIDDKVIMDIARSDFNTDISNDVNIEQIKTDIKKRLFEEARLRALDKAEKTAIEEAVTNGADIKSVTILDIGDTPLAYLPGNATKIHCKAVGDIKSSREHAVLIGPDFCIGKIIFDDQLLPTDVIQTNTEQIDTRLNILTEPHVNENGEWILAEYDIECIGIGAGILGCGGGGSPHLGKLLAKRAIREGKVIKVVNPYRFLSDKHVTQEVCVEVAYMGAPSVISEKLVNKETITSLQCMKNLFSSGLYQDGDACEKTDSGIQQKNGVLFTEDKKLYSGEDITECSTIGEKKQIVALFSAEIGGLNAIEPLIVGAELNLPIVDCDGMGRAFPELQMFCPLIYDAKPYPATLADDTGRRVAVIHAETAKDLEKFFRSVVVEMGCTGGFIINFLTKSELLNKTVLFSISRAWRIGNEVLFARKMKANPVHAVVNHEEGLCLLSGKIIDVKRETTGGFNRGFVHISGVDKHANTLLIVEFQNENLVARKSVNQSDVWNVVACTPDLITIVDEDTSEPITTEMVRYGLRVSVLVLPIPDIMKTPQALKVVGPEAFGYENDVKYIPVGKYKEPKPVVP